MAERKETVRKEKYTYPTSNKELLIRINKIFFKDGTCRLGGVLLNAKNEQPCSKRLKREARNAEDAIYKERQLCNALMAAQKKQSGSQKKRSKADRPVDSRTASALQKFRDEGMRVKDWDDETLHGAMTYYNRHFRPLVEKFEDTGYISPAEIQAWVETRTQEVLAHGRSLGIPNIAAKTVEKSLKKCLALHEELRTLEELPSIDYKPPRRSVPDIEHAKSLPEPVRQMMYRRLEALVPLEPKKVFATVLMLDAALRTGEAAAVYPCDVKHYDGFSALPIRWQDKEGHRNKVLKTWNSYRIVPLSRWACNMLAKCQQYIGDFDWDSGRVMTPERELSDWIKNLLIDCGCSKKFLEQARRLQEMFPDRDVDGTILFDLMAYVLRRDAASRMRNICGFTQYELDYVLGHKPVERAPKNARPTYRTVDELYPLAQKLERYKYDPSVGGTLISVTDSCEIQPLSSTDQHIHIDSKEPLMVCIEIDAVEPGETLEITAPSAADHVASRSMPIQPVKDRTVIGGQNEKRKKGQMGEI